MTKKANTPTSGSRHRVRARRSGHLPVELGRGAEDDFNILLEHLGFRILRKRTDFPTIDFVAEFNGTLNLPPELGYRKITLSSPIFAPSGTCAFSVKRGKVSSGDVTELKKKVKKATQSSDPVMRRIKGSLVVTNQFMTEDQLDKIHSKGVYCWDIKRLCFYAAKSRTAMRLSESGPVTEIPLPVKFKASFLKTPAELLDRTTLLMKICMFVDDHRANLGHDHVKRLLEQVHTLGLRTVAESTDYRVQMQLSLHVLGRVDRDLARSAYEDSGADKSHSDVTFAALPTFEIYQYASAPWAPIVRLP